MRLRAFDANRRRKIAAGLTLIELMVALGLGSLVMTAVGALSVYSARTFSAMANYVDLDVHSRNALDVISRDLRQATGVVQIRTTSGVRFLTLTNVDTASSLKVTWDKDAGTLVYEKTGQPPETCLIGCDRWNFTLFNRAPNINSTNIAFNTATNLTDCKVINMSWKCSRTILGSKLNTESVQTAQIVLRNKVR